MYFELQIRIFSYVSEGINSVGPLDVFYTLIKFVFLVGIKSLILRSPVQLF